MAIRNLFMRCVTTGRTSVVRPLLPTPGEKDKDVELVEQLNAYLRVIQDRIIDLSEIGKSLVCVIPAVLIARKQTDVIIERVFGRALCVIDCS